MIGCKAHGRTRKGVKIDYDIYGIWMHCWCGLDLKCQWKAHQEWTYTVFEKTICTPSKHFSEHNRCHFYGKSTYYMNDYWKQWVWKKRDVQCGRHGIGYDHCRLCKEPLPGEVLGQVNGEWQYAPMTLAKRIYRALTTF